MSSRENDPLRWPSPEPADVEALRRSADGSRSMSGTEYAEFLEAHEGADDRLLDRGLASDDWEPFRLD